MFEIGNSLREARERQGLDHSQVELATKIRAKYIRALEEEEFEVLPAGTYTVAVWHETFGAARQIVTVGERELKELDFIFEAQ